MILRQTNSENFIVLGPCFVHGLMDGEGVLGAIPDPWKARMKIWDEDFFFRPHFFNTVTKDPRMFPEPLKQRGIQLESFRLV
jgi:hypothetical protein